MTKFCPNCGIENDDNAKFCKKCGSSFDNQVKEDSKIVRNDSNSVKNDSKKNIVIIALVSIICIAFVLGTVLYLNGGLFNQKEPMHIVNSTFSTDHTLSAKTICTINVGSNHSNENVTVDILYSRDGSNLNDGDRTRKTVGSDGSFVCESKDAFKKYPDRAIITLYDDEGKVLDIADVTLATDDSTQAAIGNGTISAKSITKAEHSASGSSSSSSSSSNSGVTEWVEDLDLSGKAGYECHVYIHHRSDGIKYYIDDEGTNHSAPESQEWVF